MKPIRTMHARPGLPMFAVLTVILFTGMLGTLVIGSNAGLGTLQKLLRLVPDTLPLGDAEIRVQDQWVMRSSRDSSGSGARMWGMFELWTPPQSDPFPKGPFYRFEFRGECDGRTDLVLTELGAEHSRAIQRLFELPSEETRSANYQVGRFGQWGSVQTRISGGSRILLIVPELRITIGVADPESLACVSADAFRRAGSLPTEQDPLGVSAS